MDTTTEVTNNEVTNNKRPLRDGVSLSSVSVTEFKKRAASVINNVLDGQPIALLRNNKPETVLITLEDYFDLVETWRQRGLK
ncbi:MAG: Antitoxin Phd YefM, type toxin-antitoxin system [Gammaproteobacteria bacterium]|nr:Antitoxin Phd YefM, type toxin-antitoxin system [Gammaproteobacteria bacterium]